MGDVRKFSAWSFLRNVLLQGRDIHLDHVSKDYESYSARVDKAAREREEELELALSARAAVPEGDDCPHDAWQEIGGWCKCETCGRGWSAAAAPQPAGEACSRCGAPSRTECRNRVGHDGAGGAYYLCEQPAPSQPAGQSEDQLALKQILDYADELKARDASRARAQWEREHAELLAREPAPSAPAPINSPPEFPDNCVDSSAPADVEALAKAVLDARSHIGPSRPDDPDDAQQWDHLTEAARRLSGAQQAAEDFELPIPMGCQCQADVEIGTHANQVELETPEFMRALGRVGCLTFRETTSVDRCVAPLVQALWERGVITTGSCCGHNQRGGYIGIYVAAHAAKDGAA